MIDNTFDANGIFDPDGNAPLFAATIHYNSVSTTPSTAPAPSAGISVTVGGKTVTWTDAAPFINANSRTMVPLRAVADAMALTVNWDASAREASFTNGTKTIIFPIDSISARTSDGGTVTMDTAAAISNGRSYAPIRYLAEFFGYTVDWDAVDKMRRLILNDTDNAGPPPGGPPRPKEGSIAYLRRTREGVSSQRDSPGRRQNYRDVRTVLPRG